MNKNKNNDKIWNKEKFWESRRVWASGLTLIVTIGLVLLPEKSELIVMVGGIIASGLGLSSWKFPKK